MGVPIHPPASHLREKRGYTNQVDALQVHMTASNPELIARHESHPAGVEGAARKWAAFPCHSDHLCHGHPGVGAGLHHRGGGADGPGGSGQQGHAAHLAHSCICSLDLNSSAYEETRLTCGAAVPARSSFKSTEAVCSITSHAQTAPSFFAWGDRVSAPSRQNDTISANSSVRLMRPVRDRGPL